MAISSYIYGKKINDNDADVRTIMCNADKDNRDYSAKNDAVMVGKNDDNNEESEMSARVPIQNDPSISDSFLIFDNSVFRLSMNDMFHTI